MNRHIKIAIVMVPVLILSGYVFTGIITNNQEKPVSGVHELVLQGECKPVATSCTFRQSGIEIKLISELRKNKLQIAAITNTDIRRLSLAFSDQSGSFSELKMVPYKNNKYWQALLKPDQFLEKYDKLRMAVSTDTAGYYTETKVVF